MTDEQMDARLRLAGEEWRAANETSLDALPSGSEPLDLSQPQVRPPGRRWLLLSAAVVVAALVAGGGFLVASLSGKDIKHPPATAGIEGTVWRLVAIGNEAPQPLSLSMLYISKDGKLIADDGCALIGVSVDVRDSQISPVRFDVRRQVCAYRGPTVPVSSIDELLTSFPSYSVTRDALTIGAGPQAMHLIAAPDLPVPTLDLPAIGSTDWQLTKVTDGTGQDHPVAGAARFRIDGTQVTASDGCNTLSGDLGVLDSSTMDLKQLASTAIGCTGDTGATAAVVDAVFSGTVEYGVTGTQLTLARQGAGTLVYEWVPPDSAATDPAGLEGRTWHLMSIAGDPTAFDVTLRVDSAGTASIWDGCELWTGDTGTSTFDLRMQVNSGPPCTQKELARTLDGFLLRRTAIWSIQDGQLVIYGSGPQANSLVFSTSTPSPLPPDNGPLVGTTWTLNSMSSAGSGSASGTASPLMQNIKLSFDGAGHVTISHRCYVDKGDVQIVGKTLDISNVTLDSAIPCPATQTQAEEQHDDAIADDVLSGQSAWSIEQPQLQITKGARSLEFVR